MLIDFGDGTAGVAKKIAFKKSSRWADDIVRVDKGKLGAILDQGISMKIGTGAEYNTFTWSYYFPKNPLIMSLDSNFSELSFDAIDISAVWVNGMPTACEYISYEQAMPESVWVWCIFEYHA